MIIGVLKETRKNEARAALSLDTAKKIIALKHELIIEEGAGLASFINDADYASVGVKVVDRKEVFNATLILMVNAMPEIDFQYLKPNHVLVGMLEPFNK